MLRIVLIVSFAVCLTQAVAHGAEPLGGWRGNGTGIWKGAPPLSWHRLPRGALDGLRTQTDRPHDDQPGDAPLVEKGQIRQWLVLGSFAVSNSADEFDHDPLKGEADVQPTNGENLADREWQVVGLAAIDDPKVFGTAEVPALNLAKTLGFKQNQLAYAHAYLYSPRGGAAQIVADHSWGLKAWVNGKEVFRRVDRQFMLGHYPSLSRFELEYWTETSSKFPITLKAGWNRILLKLSTPGPNGHEEMICNLRIIDTPEVAYDEENIVWMSELPGRSTSTPIIVGERIFLMAEPDELVCLDKATGKTLWTAANNHYEALTAEERAANPAYAEKVAPLVEALRREQDRAERVKLRGKVQETLYEIDRARFNIPRDGHFDAHFGIVGYTMPTPISDGKFVYVWCGMGVAACYDLEGHRRWITPVKSGPLTYASCPAMADGVLAVFLNRLFGIDAKTGEILWDQPRVSKNTAALLSATIGGQEVIVTQESHVIRPKDGQILFRPRGISSSDTGWSPGTFVGDVLYSPRYGIKNLIIRDFADQTGEDWKPKELGVIETPSVLDRAPDGGWLDRSTAASPLVVGRYAYSIDMYSQLCVYDLETKTVAHHRELELNGLTHYNALAVAASPTLIGDHIVILDNQGTALVLTTGAEPKVVQRNVIATQIDRTLPLPAQEILSYAPPIVDGDRIYLRGERYLYCIGKK